MKRSRCWLSLIPAIGVIVAMMAGCALQEHPPVAIYTVEPGWSQSAQAAMEKKGVTIIQVATVRGAAAFTSTDILYSDKPYSQRSYAYSRWRDAPVRLMQTVLEVTLQQSGLFRDVLPPVSASRSDLLLESTLLEFGQVFEKDGSSAGVVRMRFHLVDNNNKMVLAGKELATSIPVATADARGAAAAINAAAMKVAGDLVGWMAEVTK